jgi:hypothetical protein
MQTGETIARRPARRARPLAGVDVVGAQARGGGGAAGTYRRDTAFACRLVGGRIAERWAIRDDLAMLIQPGAITPSL